MSMFELCKLWSNDAIVKMTQRLRHGIVSRKSAAEEDRRVSIPTEILGKLLL